MYVLQIAAKLQNSVSHGHYVSSQKMSVAFDEHQLLKQFVAETGTVGAKNLSRRTENSLDGGRRCRYSQKAAADRCHSGEPVLIVSPVQERIAIGVNALFVEESCHLRIRGNVDCVFHEREQ